MSLKWCYMLHVHGFASHLSSFTSSLALCGGPEMGLDGWLGGSA